MKSAYLTCPACYRQSLTEVTNKGETCWQCSNRDCGRSFSPDQLMPADWHGLVFDAGMNRADEPSEARDRYRIPTTVAGQIYELRRLFRL